MGTRVALAALPFPNIPEHLASRDYPARMEPCPEVRDWAREMFLDFQSTFYNSDHEHLEQASLGFLWTNRKFLDKGRHVLGEASMGQPTGKPWSQMQRTMLYSEWFGEIPDFVITLDAVFLAEAGPDQICAVIEHELYHCGLMKDKYGETVFDPITGLPRFCIRGHDIEEFTGVVGRYGPWNKGLKLMREALNQKPLYGPVELDGICGTCGR